MVTIEADGMMGYRGIELGKTKTVITGDKYVESIKCSPSMYTELLRKQINNAENTIIPCYKPEAKSMLQALATIKKYYKAEDIKIQGELPAETYECKEGYAY